MTAQQPPRLLRGIPLAVRNLQKTFGARQVLRDIDLHIPAGQFVAVVGRSGCGKVPCCACSPASTSQRAVTCSPVLRRSAMRGRHPIDVPGSAFAAMEKDHRQRRPRP